jgi:hypothetical protein
MAVINFPDSPSDGDTQDVGGITYTYSSSKGYWTAAASGGAGGGGASVTTDDTAPSSPSDGDLWYDTHDGGMFVYYEDTDSAQWVEVIGSAGAAGADGADGATGPAGADGSAAVYATVDDLPGTASAGDQAFVTASNRLYLWNGSGWYNIALINTTPSISGVSSSYGLAIDGTATTVTITATDPEGLPITYSIASDTSGNIATVTQNANVFTITPSTNTANAGSFSLTFRASDGVNIATAPATFTLQFKVVNQKYTTALITSVGTNNATNSTFVDSSTNSHTITAAGNATQTTFSPYRHGGYSMRTTAGTSLNIPASTDNQFTGDFTIEGWVYSLDTGDKSLYVHGSYFAFNVNFGGGFNIYLNSGGATFSPTDIVPAANEWNHVALVRSGSTVSVYLNGVASATTATNSATLGYNSIAYIGGLGTQAAGSINGYITDFRVVNGSAVYTSNFTPPTERLTAITNTSVLACHLPYIADGSTNNKNLTSSGNTKTEPFSPYDSQEYSAGSHGGSMYFDGTGDYLSIADHADLDMGSSDFTIEGWYYPVVTPGGSNGLLSKRANSSEANGILIYFGGTSTGQPSLLVAQSGSWAINTASSITFKTGQWNHFAIVRNGTSFKLYINGKAGVSVTSSITVTDNGHPFIIGTMGADGSNVLAESNIADFRVVKGAAVYTADFTPPTAPLTTITNTSLLVQGTNAGIIDKAQAVKSVKLMGDTKSSTTESKYLTSSIKFDGNDHMLMRSIELGSSDYTVECWAWISAQGGTAGIFSKGSPGGLSSITWSLEFSSSNNYVALYIYAANSGAYVITGSTNIITSSWNHIAVTRSGNETKLFVNGTQDGSTYTGNYTVADGGDFYLGGGFYAPTSRTITGYMSDFRVTKGLARYTANFTPPTAALEG